MKKGKRLFTMLAALVLAAGTAVSVQYSCPAAIIAEAAESKSVEALVKEYRTHLLNRDGSFDIEMPADLMTVENIDSIISGALDETGVGNEGDYLRWNLRSFSYKTGYSGGKCVVSFTMRYNTTAEQEKAADKKIAEIVSKLDIGSGSEYEKIKAAYNYVRDNVKYTESYTSEDRQIFTAYGAAVNGNAVCEGYAMLFYRLLRELGVSCRAIPGESGGIAHMWNIAAISGEYYLFDCTYDSTLGGTEYFFMKGTEDFDKQFPDHTHVFKVSKPDSVLLADYARADFWNGYPLAKTAYDPKNAPKYGIGDVNMDGAVNSNDASAVLAAYAQLSTTGRCGLTAAQMTAADVNCDGSVNSSDASAILSYYALASTGSHITPSEYFKDRW